MSSRTANYHHHHHDEPPGLVETEDNDGPPGLEAETYYGSRNPQDPPSLPWTPSNEKETMMYAEIMAVVNEPNAFKVLGLDPNDSSITDDVVKKAGKKLVIKFHPDKNKVHGAENAMKHVGNAMRDLGSPQLRNSYKAGLRGDDLHEGRGFAHSNAGSFPSSSMDDFLQSIFGDLFVQQPGGGRGIPIATFNGTSFSLGGGHGTRKRPPYREEESPQPPPPLWQYDDVEDGPPGLDEGDDGPPGLDEPNDGYGDRSLYDDDNGISLAKPPFFSLPRPGKTLPPSRSPSPASTSPPFTILTCGGYTPTLTSHRSSVLFAVCVTSWYLFSTTVNVRHLRNFDI